MHPGSKVSGVTLLELLVVLAVVSGLIFLTMEGLSGSLQAVAVTSGASLVENALNEGRTFAVAQNSTVEVRLYDVPRETGGTPSYHALQLHWVKADGSTPAAERVVSLPAGAVIDPTATHSTLIGVNSQTRAPDAVDWNLNAQTRVFHFLPDGSTDLSPATNWFLTVRAASQSDTAHFPANWACVRVDAATGKMTVFRP
jgi:uncharacterized protein (TIGR02596 family)